VLDSVGKMPLRIMVVDDCSVSRGVMEQGLERLGLWNVDHCTDADTAFQRLTAAPVSIVLSDYRMPRASGLDLLFGLRNHPTTRSIPFVLVTGAATSQVLKQARKLGMDAYLLKPYSDDQLRSALTKAVGQLGNYNT